MSLPYQTASSGDKAIAEMQRILRAFGCNKFGTMQDFEAGELIVQFEHRERMVILKASWRGYAAAWLRENPWTPRRKLTRDRHEAQALEIGGIAVYSIVRDWIKGQITAVEIGMMSFDGAFLSHLMLPSGQRVIEHIEQTGGLVQLMHLGASDGGSE